jgi:hypothetical protein
VNVVVGFRRGKHQDRNSSQLVMPLDALKHLAP